MDSFSIFGRMLLMAGMLLVLATAKAQQTSAPAVAVGPSTELHDGLEQETFSLINRYRRESSLLPLQWDNAIARLARVHSRDMAMGASDFGHDGFGDRVSRLKTVMIGLKTAGENVLESDDPDQLARKAVALWLKSPPHLHNIRGDYNYSGLGVWQNKQGAVYFTQIFVKIEPRALEVQSPPPQIVSPFGMLAQPRVRDR